MRREADVVCPLSQQEGSDVSQVVWEFSEWFQRGSFLRSLLLPVQGFGQHVLRNFSWFRLHAYHLRVESCKWHGGSGIFVIKVSVEMFKMRSMCFSFAYVLKCASCAGDTETFDNSYNYDSYAKLHLNYP